MSDRTGQNVEIIGGMAEFVGQTGRILYKEGKGSMYRVRLDEPVEVFGVGTVADDLWESRLLRTRRRPHSKVRNRY